MRTAILYCRKSTKDTREAADQSGGFERIAAEHVSEAVQYRGLDRGL